MNKNELRLRNAWARHIVNSGHGFGDKPPCSPDRCAPAIWNQYERDYASDPEDESEEDSDE